MPKNSIIILMKLLIRLCGKRRGLGMVKKLIAAGITLLILGLYFFVGTGTI